MAPLGILFVLYLRLFLEEVHLFRGTAGRYLILSIEVIAREKQPSVTLLARHHLEIDRSATNLVAELAVKALLVPAKGFQWLIYLRIHVDRPTLVDDPART